MPTREHIINNVEHYSARELYDFIMQGIITYEELSAEVGGYMAFNVRQELEQMLSSSNNNQGGYPEQPQQYGGYPGNPQNGYPGQQQYGGYPGNPQNGYPGQQQQQQYGGYPGNPQNGYPGQQQPQQQQYGGYPGNPQNGYPGQQQPQQDYQQPQQEYQQPQQFGGYPGNPENGYPGAPQNGYPGQQQQEYQAPQQEYQAPQQEYQQQEYQQQEPEPYQDNSQHYYQGSEYDENDPAQQETQMITDQGSYYGGGTQQSEETQMYPNAGASAYGDQQYGVQQQQQQQTYGGQQQQYGAQQQSYAGQEYGGGYDDNATTIVDNPFGNQATGYDPEWEMVDKNDDDALRIFVQTHPNHPMVLEANRLRNEIYKESLIPHDINTLRYEVNDIMTNKNVLDKNTKIFETIRYYLSKGFSTIPEILYVMGEDNNFLSAHVVNMLIAANYFTYMDLVNAGIDPKFIDQLVKGSETSHFTTPMPIDHVEKVSTEIYFWGIPSSGKTCALGGILSMANSGRLVRHMSQDNGCQGYGYMTRLASVFRENGTVGTLPPGTGIYDIWEMGFDLEDHDGRVHPITCIDLAGELVRCMYKHDAGEPLTEDELMTLETVTRLLVSNRSQNRKMHFFVLEYGGEERLYEGLDQSTYLAAALEYIRRTRIFDRETDAIFLLFTKVDKAKLRGPALVEHLKEYTDRYYSNFYNGLVGICQENEINGGRVERIPFTLGNVCFQNYCVFDGVTAEGVVKKILDRSKGFKKGKMQKFINKVKR